MTTQNPTRRAVLCATAALPATLIASAASAVRPSARDAAGLSHDLTALIVEARAHSAASEAYHRTVYEPAYQRMEAAIAAVPHVEITGGKNVLGGIIVRSTANPGTVASNRTLVAMAREGKIPDPEAVAYARRFHAAVLHRQRAIGRIRDQSGVPQMADRSNALVETTAEAMDAVARFPVKSMADLALKLAFMIEQDMGDGRDWLTQMQTDTHALAGVI